MPTDTSEGIVVPAVQPGLDRWSRQSAESELEADPDKGGRALSRVMTALLQDDTQLFKYFAADESFRQWMKEMVFGQTYGPGPKPQPGV